MKQRVEKTPKFKKALRLPNTKFQQSNRHEASLFRQERIRGDRRFTVDIDGYTDVSR